MSNEVHEKKELDPRRLSIEELEKSASLAKRKIKSRDHKYYNACGECIGSVFCDATGWFRLSVKELNPHHFPRVDREYVVFRSFTEAATNLLPALLSAGYELYY